MTPSSDASRTNPKTQKAKGYYNLTRGYFRVPYLNAPSLKFLLLPYDNELVNLSLFYGMPTWFARPCPLTPRHGFVDSIAVNNPTQVAEVLRRTLKEDKDGEVLLVPLLSGKYSGVATSASVTWGLGNEGVTGGAQSYTIPTPGTNKDHWVDAFLRYNSNNSGIDNHLYVEMVEDNGNMVAVQLRDGPEPPITKDFIPIGMTVKRVLTNHGFDLLQWERKVKEAEPGTVIYLCNGSLSSHWAVHGLAAGMPVITTFEPQVGDILNPTSLQIPTLNESEYLGIASNLKKRLERKISLKSLLTSWSPRLLTAIATIQSQSFWDGTGHLQNLRADAVSTILRSAVAACLGELRHWYGEGPGRPFDSSGIGRKPETLNTVLPIRWWIDSLACISRDDIYANAATSPTNIEEVISLLNNASRDYRAKGWRHTKHNKKACKRDRCRLTVGQRSYGFGGPKWADCCEAGVCLARATQDFLYKPSAETWNKAIEKANILINLSHNGGKLLTKFISESRMSQISCTPGLGFMNTEAAKIVLGISDEIEEIY